jgi:hypothetical protein
MRLKLSVLGLLAGLMLQSPLMAADAAGYAIVLEKAENTLCDAATKVQLWSTSEILLDNAAKAAESGDFEQAIKMADEARIQAELAVATAERETKVWQNGVPK